MPSVGLPEPSTSAEFQFPDIHYEDDRDRPKGPPVKLQVSAALEVYPHIIKKICLMWRSSELEKYLDELVIDSRGGRQGFSPEVMEELLFLSRFSKVAAKSRDSWAGLTHVGDRR